MPAAKCFIDGVISEGWKFNPSLQQIHDNTYVDNKLLYKTLKQHVQVGCKENSFEI